MSASMIEQVARAICGAWYYAPMGTPDGDANWRRNEKRCLAEARAAIEAMREPMEKMVAAGNDAWMIAIGQENKDSADIFSRMIDAALEE